MKLDYIYHSGFAIEAEGVTIIIDYYKDSSETIRNQGIVHDCLLQKPGKLYVLSTHFHPDHFNREILTWKEQRPDIIYLFSKDILKHRRANPEDAIYINKGESYEDDNLRIDAYSMPAISTTGIGVKNRPNKKYVKPTEISWQKSSTLNNKFPPSISLCFRWTGEWEKII